MNYHKSIESLLTPLPKHIVIAFAIHCCNDIKHLMNKESLHCLNLTEKWLANNDSVTSNELFTAAHITAHTIANTDTSTIYSAAYAATATANAATYAAYAANAAAYAATAATYSAAHAANAAAYAATAAINTAAHATYAAYADNKEAKMKEYYDYLVNYINNLTLLEKELYNLW